MMGDISGLDWLIAIGGIVVVSIFGYTVQRVIVVAQLITQQINDLWKWHSPITTDTGETFSWKSDREMARQLTQVITLVEHLCQKVDILIQQLEAERKQRNSFVSQFPPRAGREGE